MTALWVLPLMTYANMASSTETTASSSAAGVTHPSHLPPGRPATEPMDTLPALTMENLLATAGVGWGRKPRTSPQMPTALGLCQTRPQVTPQQVLTPSGQGAMTAMPYCQQAFPPKRPAPNLSTTPSTTGALPERQKVTGEGPHPEGLRTGYEGADPPPEDPGSTDEAPPVTVSQTVWPTTWLWGGNRTSLMLLAAAGQPR